MFSVLFQDKVHNQLEWQKNYTIILIMLKIFLMKADDILNLSISKIIFEGPKELLDQTENTQPAIF